MDGPKPYCHKRIYGGSFTGRHCYRPPFLGSNLCKFHQPAAVAAREKQLREKWAAKTRTRNLRFDAEKEMRRRARLFEELVEMLKLARKEILRGGFPERYRVIDKIDEVIAKAGKGEG